MAGCFRSDGKPVFSWDYRCTFITELILHYFHQHKYMVFACLETFSWETSEFCLSFWHTMNNEQISSAWYFSYFKLFKKMLFGLFSSFLKYFKDIYKKCMLELTMNSKSLDKITCMSSLRSWLIQALKYIIPTVRFHFFGAFISFKQTGLNFTNSCPRLEEVQRFWTHCLYRRSRLLNGSVVTGNRIHRADKEKTFRNGNGEVKQ